MGMKGFVCALSPERRRLVEEDPSLVSEIGDRNVEIDGRVFYDAGHLPERLRQWAPGCPTVVGLIEATLGRGFGAKGQWAFGRPRIVDGEDLDRLSAELAALNEDAVLEARRTADGDLDALDTEMAEADDRFLVRLRTIVARERERSGALLVHVT